MHSMRAWDSLTSVVISGGEWKKRGGGGAAGMRACFDLTSTARVFVSRSSECRVTIDTWIWRRPMPRYRSFQSAGGGGEGARSRSFRSTPTRVYLPNEKKNIFFCCRAPEVYSPVARITVILLSFCRNFLFAKKKKKMKTFCMRWFRNYLL